MADEVFVMPETCSHPECDATPIVGIGGPAGPVLWVCAQHFGEALSALSGTIERAVRHALTARWN